jgi:hypothetical protein
MGLGMEVHRVYTRIVHKFPESGLKFELHVGD